MQLDKNIIIFKNITTGFMDIKNINYLADIFDKKNELKDKFYFVLQNDASNEVNQAIMQMYNKLMGFNIFCAASSKGNLLEYKQLNELELRHKINSEKKELNEYLKDKFQNFKIYTYIVEDDIYPNIFSIINNKI